MKNMSILYGIAIIAVIGIVVCSVSSSIVPAPMDTPQQSAYTVKSKQALKKTSCASCSVSLFTFITVQLAIIPQLAAQDEDDLPQPLP